MSKQIRRVIEMLNIAGMNFHYVRFPFVYFLDSMVRFGIKNIEIWGGAPHFYIEDLSLQDIYMIKKEVNKRDLNIICLTPEQCVYPINIAAKDYNMRERSINYFKKSISIANELGVSYVLVTPGWGYFNEKKEDGWRRSSESLKSLTIYAEKLGITLVLEPLKPTESNIINESHSLKKMIEEVNSSNLKGMIDTNPMAIMNEDMNDYFRLLKDDLVHIHFIDGPDGHLVWGDGTLPMDDYVKVLKKNAYNGYLTLEYTSSRYYLDPDIAIQRTLEKLSLYNINKE